MAKIVSTKHLRSIIISQPLALFGHGSDRALVSPFPRIPQDASTNSPPTEDNLSPPKNNDYPDCHKIHRHVHECRWVQQDNAATGERRAVPSLP